MSSTSLSLCGQKGEWAFTNWVSIKDVQHFQKHRKKGGKESNENKTCRRTWTQRQRGVEQLRPSELQNVPLWESKRESGRAKPASLRFEASPAMLGAREANSVDKQPQQRTDALQSYSRNVLETTNLSYAPWLFIECALFTCRDACVAAKLGN